MEPTNEERMLDEMERVVYLAISYLNSRENWVYFGLAQKLADELGITIDRVLIKKLVAKINNNPRASIVCGEVINREGELSLEVFNPNGRD